MVIINKNIAVVLAAGLFLTSVNSVIALYKRPTKISRRFAVRPMNRERNKEGFFATVVHDMKNIEFDHEQFFKLTRMTPALFDHLLGLVKEHLLVSVRMRSKRTILSPEHRLMITINYLAQGCSMQQIAWTYRIGKSTAHYIIKDTCQALWHVLSPSQLPVLKKNDWLKISEGYYKRWNLPNCIGSVDGKHVNIKAPNNSGSEFFNYKKSFSLVLLATCDSYYRFTTVDIGAAGGNHDSTVFKGSGFGEALINNKLDIPPASYLPKTNIEFPFYIAADAAFPLHKHIMRPYPGKYLGEKHNIYNYRISRGRRTMENTFGILAQRWRILLRPIEASIEVAELIVQATVVLHNFLQSCEEDLPITERKYCPTGFADYIGDNGVIYDGAWREAERNLTSVKRVGANDFSQALRAQRDLLADYFVAPEGALPWQQNYVFRGGAPGI